MMHRVRHPFHPAQPPSNTSAHRSTQGTRWALMFSDILVNSVIKWMIWLAVDATCISQWKIELNHCCIECPHYL